MISKKEKAVKSLKLLFIGELLISIGLLGELGLIYAPFSFISLISLIGMIIALVGIIKLAKVNKFFLLSCIAMGVSILLGFVTGGLSLTGVSENIISNMRTATNIIGKLLSFVFVFGIIRGCSKAATGSARSKIATIMTIVNFTGKALAIAFVILNAIFEESNPQLANGFALASTLSTIAVDLYFTYYVFIAYKKAKSLNTSTSSTK